MRKSYLETLKHDVMLNKGTEPSIPQALTTYSESKDGGVLTNCA